MSPKRPRWAPLGDDHSTGEPQRRQPFGAPESRRIQSRRLWRETTVCARPHRARGAWFLVRRDLTARAGQARQARHRPEPQRSLHRLECFIVSSAEARITPNGNCCARRPRVGYTSPMRITCCARALLAATLSAASCSGNLDGDPMDGSVGAPDGTSGGHDSRGPIAPPSVTCEPVAGGGSTTVAAPSLWRAVQRCLSRGLARIPRRR
jgi:hypothetical protein